MEMFLLALQVVSDRESVDELNKWAADVYHFQAVFVSQGVAGLPDEFKVTKKVQAPGVFKRLEHAHENVRSAEKLGQILVAMKSKYMGKTDLDQLTVQHLKNYFGKLADQRRSKKCKGPPRWKKHEALFGVAKLVRGAGGVELRRLLGDNELKVKGRGELLAEVEELSQQVTQVRDNLAKKTDAHRKLKEAEAAKRYKVKEARAQERRAATSDKRALKKSAKVKHNERLAEERERAKERADKRAREDVKTLLDKKDAATQRAKARVQKVESEASASTKKLKERALRAERELKRMKQDAWAEEVEADEAMDEDEDEDEEPPQQVVGRRDERGRFKADDWRLRPIEWGQLSRRCPPSAVAANVRDVLRVHAPDVEYAEPTERQMRARRAEVTVASECLANVRVALSKRIISFGSDESSKWDDQIFSTNTQIEPHDAPGTTVDVVQRGCTLTAGGTAEALLESIETDIFAHGRQLINGWKEVHERKHGEGSWAAAGMPEAESLGMHRLAENAVIMGDTCSTAEKLKRLVKEAAEVAAKEKIGDAAWEKMSEEERATKCTAYVGHCHQHLRNIIINAMLIKQTESLKNELQESLAEFSSFDRMSVDIVDLIRAVYKELHKSGAYAKGKGKEFKAWLDVTFPEICSPRLLRAEGSRQDMGFEGAVPIFAARKVILTFLQGLRVPGASNMLEEFLLRSLSCNEMTAALRANTLWYYLFSEPMRWLAGKGSELGMGLDDSAEMCDLVEKMMTEVAADGSRLLDPTFDPFAPLAAKYQAFADWRAKHLMRTVKGPDGKSHPVHKTALAEARLPAGAGNVQAHGRTLELIEEMAAAALAAMRDPRRAICGLLQSQEGTFAVGSDPKRNKATKGAHATNDRVESNFGCIDMLMRMFRYASINAISGMAQQMVNRDFETPPNVLSDRRKRKHEKSEHKGGYFYTGLTPELQESLVEYSRHEVAHARDANRQAQKAQAAHKLAKREERVITLLNKAVEQYAYAKELFVAWAQPGGQRARSKADVKAALHETISGKLRPKPEAQQLEWLRRQVEMRVLGLGWTQYATRWSSNKNARIGTVAHLTELLEEIIEEEKSRERFTAGTERGLPKEPAPPQGEWRDAKQLGTLDADAQTVRSQARFSAEQLEQLAQKEMQRRVAAGISDDVEARQPERAPEFDQQLVGKRLEVLWKYLDKNTEQPHYIWCTGRVVRIADGLTDKRSQRARSILPGGAVLWAWDADPEFEEAAGEQWLVLLPSKWNPSTHKQVYSWRYDPRELGAARAAEPDQRRKHMRCERP